MSGLLVESIFVKKKMASGPKGHSKKKIDGDRTPVSVRNANGSIRPLKTPTKIVAELARVCLVIDLEGFRIPNEWVIRSLKIDGRFIDPYLWGPKTTFVIHEMVWCPIESPSEGVRVPVRSSNAKIRFAVALLPVYQVCHASLHGLALHPRNMALRLGRALLDL